MRRLLVPLAVALPVAILFTLKFLWRQRFLFWRLIALASFAWLIYDRIYETGATIASTGADPHDPFYFPFSIANNSHIFNVKGVRWSCALDKATFGSLTFENARAEIGGTIPEIAAGDTANISCRRAFNIRGLRPSRLEVWVRIEYTTSLFGLPLKRSSAAFFTWTSDSTVQTWIRGTIYQ